MLAVRPEDALRFVAARQGHPDGHAASPGRRGGRGRRDLADPAALQGMPAESPPAGGVVILRRPAGWPGAARHRATDTTARPTGRRMALNRYRLAAMLGLCGCLAGVQAQTIPVELEVGKAGCCPIRACGAWRSATGGYCARPTPTGRNRHFGRAEGRVLGACLDGRWTAHRLCVQSRAGRRGARAEVEALLARIPSARRRRSSSKATICPTRTAPASPRWPSAIRPCWTSRDRSAGTAWCCWTCRSWRSRPRACVSSA